MKILICDKTEKEYIEQMRAAGLTVDVRDDITPEELMTVLPGYDGNGRSLADQGRPAVDRRLSQPEGDRTPGGAGLDTTRS